MDTAELDNSLREVMEKGFDDSFAAFCAKTYSSYEYPPENQAAAKMHAFYLRIALESLCENEKKAEILGGNTGFISLSPLERLCFKTASIASNEALCGRGSFAEIFVDNWCKSLSSRLL